MRIRRPQVYTMRCLLPVIWAWSVACPLTGQDPAVAVDTRDLPPPGYGTLKQDDVSLTLQVGSVSIQVLPLNEWVTRLLAPDTYLSLHSLHEALVDTVADMTTRSGIGGSNLFLVTFFGLQEFARFEPEILTITSQNRFFRPVAILPRSPQWARRQLNQRETASAVYVYEEGIQLREPFTVSYAGLSTDRWEQVLRVLDRERSRALARAAADQKPEP
jgi:hypothetical protein